METGPSWHNMTALWLQIKWSKRRSDHQTRQCCCGKGANHADRRTALLFLLAPLAVTATHRLDRRFHKRQAMSVNVGVVRRGRPPNHVAQSSLSTPYEKRRPRGGRSSDAIAKARQAVRLPAPSTPAAATTARFRAWPPHAALEALRKESAGIAANGADAVVSAGDGLIVSVVEATQLARFRMLLRTMYDFDDFRGIQLEALLESGVRRKDTFVVWRTGGGKSILYSLPALEPRTLTVVIMPLVALIDDQLQCLADRKIGAVGLHAQMTAAEVDASMTRLWSTPTAVKLLLLSAEKVVFNGQVMAVLQQLVQAGRRLRFAVDEAHCVLEWGDFRPAYSKLAFLKEAFPDAPMLALTATATPAEARSIARCLGMQAPVFVRGCTDRPEITFAADPARAAYLTRAMSDLIRLVQDKHPGQSGIVYVTSAKAVARVTDALVQAKVRAAGYHGQMSPDERPRVLRAWRNGEVDVVVGTSAFGMGIDMPTCRFVIHLQCPSSMMSLQQQQGRVSRDGNAGHAYFFTAQSDERLWGCIFAKSAQEQVQMERRRHGLDLLDAKDLQSEVIKRTSSSHAKLREVSLFAKSSVCRRWALNGGMVEVADTAQPKRFCQGESKCDNCSAKSLRTIDVTKHVALMVAVVRELPGRSLDDLVAVFTRSKSKTLSPSLAKAATYSDEFPLRTMLGARPTRAVAEYVLDVLVVRGMVVVSAIVPELVEPESDDDEEESARPQRLVCTFTYSLAPSSAHQDVARTFFHTK